MALNSNPPADAASDHEESALSQKDYNKFEQEYDIEDQPRRGSRVAPVHDADDRASIGKQLELEAENAIKYRTCSWQKVSFNLLTLGSCIRHVLTQIRSRLLPCSFRSTSVWPSCRSRGHTRFSAWCRVLF
jgi:hypothetical protein